MQIFFHHNRVPIIYRYNLINSEISIVNEVKSTGIILESDLSFKPHVESTNQFVEKHIEM
jgi:hypothetical protein